jgi:hypothetical protein
MVVVVFSIIIMIMLVLFIVEIADWYEKFDEKTIVLSYKDIELIIKTLLKSKNEITYNNQNIVIINQNNYKKFIINNEGISIIQYYNHNSLIHGYYDYNAEKILSTKNFIAYKTLLRKMKKVIDTAYKESLITAIIKGNGNLDIAIPTSKLDKIFSKTINKNSEKENQIVEEFIGFRIEPRG